ncbi:DUF5979 domain-containing protein [Corynebacterium pseudotuberculosis]|uniref:DUF5979 domain-containing protein n=1 Tax=Corynebacterium pseudotuberculosis TaxID=1719 RepID=UPI000A6AA0AC|nr:DUF5979 domain-containing protein [Corynebacterium pseudotuberculosis]
MPAATGRISAGKAIVLTSKATNNIGPSGFAEVEFDWQAKKEAKAGDTIDFTLPSELRAVDTGTIALKDKRGEVVATGKWSDDKFIITLTEFQNRHFDVEGSAFVSVTWKITREFNSYLIFKGCGNESLPGKFEKREGGLFHDDSKIGEYRGYNDKTGKHVIHWSVGIDPKKHKNEYAHRRVVVTDRAPEGWKFTCDGQDTNGYAPAYVTSFIKSGDHPKEVRHVIYNANGDSGGGTRNGFINITQLGDFRQGHNYTLNCRPEEVSVEFPYGLYEQSGPILALTAVTDKTPAPGSIIKNKAKIDHVDVEGHVRFPNAGGLGRGSKGGFTIEKTVVGTDEDKAKDYTFEYECKDSHGAVKKQGSLNVKHNEFKHVKDLEKGLKCTVKEKNSLNQIGRKLTVSWVLFDKNKEVKSFGSESHVDFEIDEKFNEAVHIVVTNKFKENTGGFTLEKKVKYEDDEDEDELEGKEFTFEWKCTTDGKEVVKGSTKLKDKEEN